MTFRLGKGNSWQGVSVPQGAGRVTAQLLVFLSLGLAWLEMCMAMLQEESEEGKRQVCSRDVQLAARGP